MQAMGVSWGERKGRKRAAVAMVTAAALLVPGSAASGTNARPSVLQRVIVQALPGAEARAKQAVRAAGGAIGLELHLINGFAASVPSGLHLGGSDGVRAVTPDRAMQLQTATYAPGSDAGAPVPLQSQTGANTYYQHGLYGQGVGVALVDSGVVPENGLHSNVFFGPDFTPQATDPALKFLDTYGHGTFMAGIISGRDDAAVRPYSDANNFTGIAPEANLVSLKVADALGNTAESAVVAAVDWATEHMNDKTLNIRVINLSLGAHDTGYANDPLAAAVERAWGYGITVVGSAGNEGSAGIDLPAVDPYAIAVGASDSHNTPTTTDDTVAAFSNSGAAGRNPDLVAPGTHIVSLRDTGSDVDNKHGSTGAVNAALFRGSGTSEAAAVVSGAAALLIGQHPGITPDQVKGILAGTARSIVGSTWSTAGAGALNLAGAYGAGLPAATTTNAAHAAGYGSFATSLWGGSWNNNIWQSATDALLSSGRAAQASSQESGSYPPGAAFDGNTSSTSRWASMPVDNQWLQVDLGFVAQIRSVTLNWDAGYAKAFQIQVSNDNSAWTTIYSTTTGSGGVQVLNVTGTGRFVRMFGQTRATSSGFSLDEMQVKGVGQAQACSTTNAALGKTATASSTENSSLTAPMAVDGSQGTRWGSAFADNQWLQVDLGAQTALCMVSLHWEWSYATAFQLQTSDDGSYWTTVYSTTTGTGGTQNLAVAAWGRYLRLVGITRATAYGFSLYDLQVHASTGYIAATPEGDGGALSTSRWTTSRWTGSVWTGSVWSGSVWSGTMWSGSVWSESIWS